MSHLRDIQKLRQTKQVNQNQFSHRFSQQNPPDIYNINFQKFGQIQHKNSFLPQNQSYNKFLQSKQILPKTRQKRSSHKRGFSNGLTFYQKKQSDTINNGLTIYNMSMKLNHRTPNPLTYRRQKKQDYLQYQTAFDIKERRPTKQQIKPIHQISKNSFQVLYPIGKGGFGKVWKVQNKKNLAVYAMKEMYKAKIIQKKSINSVLNQRNLLAKLKNPFIINMTYAFQDRQNLYLIMDYLDGGDLRYHIGKRGRFTQAQTKFFLANLIIGLQYLHNNNIIHRDIKPENLVLEKDGYLRITDLGVSRQLRQDNHQDTSGTPGYMAPQVMIRKNHGFPVDYFAIGVMGYQFMLGRRPYVGKNRKQIRDQILAKQAGIKMQDLPKKWSIQAADFINRLLIRNPNNRLGSNGIQQIKDHPWMKNVQWRKMQLKQLKAPYIPISIQQDYEQYKQQISQDSVQDNLQQNLLMLRDKEVQNLFQGYHFDRTQIQKSRSTSYTTTCTQSESVYRNSSRQIHQHVSSREKDQRR